MIISATETITADVELVVRSTHVGCKYPYAVISPSGETVGWLQMIGGGLYHLGMINDKSLYGISYKPDVTFFSIEDLKGA